MLFYIFKIVYGDDLYSADSSICQAGIHAGLHSNVAGEVLNK